MLVLHCPFNECCTHDIRRRCQRNVLQISDITQRCAWVVGGDCEKDPHSKKQKQQKTTTKQAPSTKPSKRFPAYYLLAALSSLERAKPPADDLYISCLVSLQPIESNGAFFSVIHGISSHVTHNYACKLFRKQRSCSSGEDALTHND
jgi:hypothetical protein